MKYVKKPIVVEAFEFGVDEMPDWFAWTVELKVIDGIVVYDKDFCLIPTLEGDMKAHKGDMIIKGVKGEIYPCKKDIFKATYEPIIGDYIIILK